MYRKVLNSVFSNWASLAVSIAIAFVVSPIMVNNLGKELYGIWALIISITGYFTVMDFGVNSAIIRYISSSVARQDYQFARAVYSTSIAIFAVSGLLVLLFSSIFGYFLIDFFEIHQITRIYLFGVFIILSIDFATGLLFSVFQGALIGLQEFRFINMTSIFINCLRSIIIVLALNTGASLLTLAFLQLISSMIKAVCQYVLLLRKYRYLSIDRNAVDRNTFSKIYSYSVFSFIIAVALKLLFYTDNVVIGSMISVSEIAFYSIPSTLLDYTEKFVWALVSVLVPIISSNDAKSDGIGNVQIYIAGTRVTLLVSIPIILSLYFFGGDFICLWIGPEIGERSKSVLQILLIGFAFSFSQLIAHGILKGISKHRVLAYILLVESLANLGMSIFLAGPYGIEGVAIGTMVPLVLGSFSVAVYSCRVLGLNILNYLYRSYTGAIVGIIVVILFTRYRYSFVDSYFNVFFESGILSVIFLSIALPLSFGTYIRKYARQYLNL